MKQRNSAIMDAAALFERLVTFFNFDSILKALPLPHCGDSPSLQYLPGSISCKFTFVENGYKLVINCSGTAFSASEEDIFFGEVSYRDNQFVGDITKHRLVEFLIVCTT